MNTVIYGGTGFVGTRVAQLLQQDGHTVTCVSRRGGMPQQLVDERWATEVSWITGDALQPDPNLLAQQAVLISAVGAPPIPTLTRSGYQKSLAINGEANANLIAAADTAGIRRIVLMSAKIPKPLRGDWFAYAKGKRLAFEAAERFAHLSDAHSAVVVQPGGLYGKRHTKSGYTIPIDWVLQPLAKLMPSQLISVDRVARCLADAALQKRATSGAFTLIAHEEI